MIVMSEQNTQREAAVQQQQAGTGEKRAGKKRKPFSGKS